jgi:hypothetical protein
MPSTVRRFAGSAIVLNEIEKPVAVAARGGGLFERDEVLSIWALTRNSTLREKLIPHSSSTTGRPSSAAKVVVSPSPGKNRRNAWTAPSWTIPSATASN